ncbi:MAG: class I SAM-dependent methyltransferase [Alphaproteobacteria bacterium]|nr:class I SAM-dependent methyltransferase [Alphaproteobacteria bacterium]
MSGFEADWLDLRAAADARARDEAGLEPALLQALAERLGADDRAVDVLDLGAGHGNNLRYLASRLAAGLRRPQHWTLVDSDGGLLAAAAAPDLPAPIRIATMRWDLAKGSPGLPLAGCDLVTASALFDLVSADWVEDFATACAAAAVPLGLFALSVDGRLDWTPREPEDAEVADLFHGHMRRDKGFGEALGPDAPDALAAAFERAGYAVERGDSAWRLGAADAAMQTALIEGYAAAAREAAPARAAAIDDWAARRAAHAARGAGRLTVGHADLLVRLTD